MNFIFPTKYVIPKSLKFSHWPSKIFFGGASCDRNFPCQKSAKSLEGSEEKPTHPGVFQIFQEPIHPFMPCVYNLMLGQQKRPNKCNNPIVDGKHVYLKGLFLSHSCFLYICFIQNQKKLLLSRKLTCPHVQETVPN